MVLSNELLSELPFKIDMLIGAMHDFVIEAARLLMPRIRQSQSRFRGWRYLIYIYDILFLELYVLYRQLTPKL